MGSFTKQNNFGKMAERLVANYLTLAGIEAFPNTTPNKSDFDLEFKLGSKKVLCEIKFDWMSCKTQNLAIEYENEKTKQPSGLMITKAHIWMVVIKDNEHYVVFATSTKRLKEYVNSHQGRVFIGAGDGNANLLLFPVDSILSIFSRLDNVDASLIPGILKRLLK